MSKNTDKEPIPWGELTDSDRERFADMLNARYGASLTVEGVAEYYGNKEKVERELGSDKRNQEGAPECPECFSPLYKSDIPHLKKTGCCPNCGEALAE